MITPKEKTRKFIHCNYLVFNRRGTRIRTWDPLLPKNAAIYGHLYKGLFITNGTGNLCPSGWHIPSQDEFNTLVDFPGGINIAGGKMKSTGTVEGGNDQKSHTEQTEMIQYIQFMYP